MKIARKEDVLIVPFVYFGFLVYFYCVDPNFKDMFTVLTVLPVAVIALFQEKIKNWWYPAVLEIEFRLQEPSSCKTPFYVKTKEANLSDNTLIIEKNIATEAYYFRALVKNSGSSCAKHCEAILKPLLVLEGSKWMCLKYSQPANLKWDMSQEKRYVDINPSPVGEYVRFGYISKKFNSDRVNLEYLFTIGGYQPVALEAKKMYQFSMIVASSNAKHIEATYRFFWSGVWKNSEEEMFKEIQLREIF